VHADPEGASEHVLREPDEAPQSCDVVTAFELTPHQTVTQAARDRSLEVSGREFPDVVTHRFGPPACR
jgi:hypothetical protein